MRVVVAREKKPYVRQSDKHREPRRAADGHAPRVAGLAGVRGAAAGAVVTGTGSKAICLSSYARSSCFMSVAELDILSVVRVFERVERVSER